MLKNSEQNYGVFSISVHWISAILFIGATILGLYLEELPWGPTKSELMDLHKSVGVILMFLILLRIVWRFISPNPPAIDTAKAWEQTMSKVVMGVLMLALLLMPLSGWIMSNAGGHSVELFTLPMPTLIGESESIKEIASSVHAILGKLAILAILLHLAGALKHHFIYKDNVLKRMWGKA